MIVPKKVSQKVFNYIKFIVELKCAKIIYKNLNLNFSDPLKLILKKNSFIN